MKILSDDPISYQGQGEQSEEFKNFIKAYDEVVHPNNKDYWQTRYWEIWAVTSNAHFKNTDNVLEYGAWPELFSVYIKSFVNSVVAIDSFQVLRRNDRERLMEKSYTPKQWVDRIDNYNLLPYLYAQFGNIEQTIFSDKSFDKIVSLGVHEHVQDDLRAMKEIHRILRDNGIVSITVDFSANGWSYYPELPGRCYDMVSLKKLVDESGFVFINEPDWSKLDYSVKNTIIDPHLFAMAIALRKR